MAFSSGHQKCAACEKIVYFSDQLTVEESIYHQACFRCKKCQNPLQVGSHAFLDGFPYCKPHYNQLTKKGSGVLGVFKVLRSAPKEPVAAPTVALKPPSQRGPIKAASFKFGTQEKCVACGKTVYALEKVSVEGLSYHKNCFKCQQGGCSISPANYAAMEGRVYCKHHFKQLFKEKGNYSGLLVKMPSAKQPSTLTFPVPEAPRSASPSRSPPPPAPVAATDAPSTPPSS